MTWGWEARGALPVDANATGTTGGGTKGTTADAAQTQAWPRYEAEYLKRALQSERYKYDTEGLDEQQRGVYLDKITALYKDEADECLKGEFDQWLEGRHECNDPDADQEYKNADGKPVRRWTMRGKESDDINGGSKVGQARAGWKHTPWGRASLTHLPGVRDYLRDQIEKANDADIRLQMLAEFGPQNIEEAWMYFKHWVKGRPLSDAVALPARFEQQAHGTRADVGPQMPTRMYAYDPDPADRQPEVYATDENAYNAAVAEPGEKPVQTTTNWEDAHVRDAKNLREQFETALNFTEPHLAEEEMQRREDRAEAKDRLVAEEELALKRREEGAQWVRKQELTAPVRELLPSLG
jgi:hypothetical protein